MRSILRTQNAWIIPKSGQKAVMKVQNSVNNDIVFYCISNWFWANPPGSLNSSTPFSATFGFTCSWLLQSQHSVWGQRCLRVGFFHTLKKRTSMWLAPVFIKNKCETKMYGKRNLENLMSQQLFFHCKNLMNCSCWERLQKRTSWTTIVKLWIYLNFSGFRNLKAPTPRFLRAFFLHSWLLKHQSIRWSFQIVYEPKFLVSNPTCFREAP